MKARGCCALVACCLAAVAVRGQEDGSSESPRLPAAPRGLDEMLAIALRSNPEILQADAQVRKAQARLNQVRLRALEEVSTAFHDRERHKAVIEGQEQALEIARRLVQTGQAPTDSVSVPQIALIEAKARLEQNEAHARYLLGLGGDGRLASTSQPAPEARPERRRPPFSERVQKLLEMKVSIQMENKSTAEIAKKLNELTGENVQVAGIQLHIVHSEKLNLQDVPLRQALEMLSEATSLPLYFVFRDYGILITSRERAMTINAPAIPEETPLKID
ncbi:MAG TPA: TolC family protein [Planctomycetota bacterium]|nr:TolC family protein [Planctomycetota bacterium]